MAAPWWQVHYGIHTACLVFQQTHCVVIYSIVKNKLGSLCLNKYHCLANRDYMTRPSETKIAQTPTCRREMMREEHTHRAGRKGNAQAQPSSREYGRSPRHLVERRGRKWRSNSEQFYGHAHVSGSLPIWMKHKRRPILPASPSPPSLTALRMLVTCLWQLLEEQPSQQRKNFKIPLARARWLFYADGRQVFDSCGFFFLLF